MGIWLDGLNQLRGDLRDGNGVRLSVLGLGPVDDPLTDVPLVDMQTGDFLDALPGEHENARGARVGRMNGRVRAFEPAIEALEFFFIEPTRSDVLGLRRDPGR